LSHYYGSVNQTQGFDEFMNLVIDDAVEVTLADPKKDKAEERRKIGQSCKFRLTALANVAQVKFCSKATTSR
jgi:small nuclear ribonucleoprotein (snRNP)-like protein